MALHDVSTGGGWTAFTPTLSASVTPPTLGTGPTQTGRYTQSGRIVVGQAIITWGTGPTVGSGTYRFVLPVTASTDAINLWCGYFLVYDASGGASDMGMMALNAATYMELWDSDANAYATHAVPWAWAVSDQMKFAFQYEAA
jgi:hypothetical protein